jgi:hypothetical protein
LTVLAGESTFVLPIRSPRSEDASVPPFEEAEGPPPLPIEPLKPGRVGSRVSRDLVSGRLELEAAMSYFGAFRISESGLEYGEQGRDRFTIVEDEPLSAEARSTWSITVGRGAWQTRVETDSRMTADAEVFRVTNVLDAFEGNARIFTKTWHFSVPRDLV